jgi:hypothetical protein
MEKISWTDCVRNEEVLLRVKKERNILYTIKRSKANWIGHILRRNCLLKHDVDGETEEGIEVTGRQQRSGKQPLEELKESRGYWKLKEETPDRIVWGTGFVSGCGPVVRQTAE